MRLRTLLMVLAMASLANVASAQRKLSVGDAAPGLDIEQWVKGEETAIESDRVYVVEFWATWCAPCRMSIPHLSQLQNEYADQDLTIIGVSDEQPQTVERFVRTQGSRMNYTVAVDRKQSTNRAWMQAAQQNGIPTAFIVDRRGILQWIGNPLDDNFDLVLGQVVAGRYDARLSAAAEQPLRAARSARKSKNWRLAHKHYDDVIAADKHVFAPLAIEKFEMQLVEQLDREGAYAYAKALKTQYAKDSQLLAELAKFIASSPKLSAEQRDFEVALELANAAKASAEPDEPRAYSTLALVYFHKGEVVSAVKYQTQAWKMADARRKAEFQRVLDSYRNAQARAQAKG